MFDSKMQLSQDHRETQDLSQITRDTFSCLLPTSQTHPLLLHPPKQEAIQWGATCPLNLCNNPSNRYNRSPVGPHQIQEWEMSTCLGHTAGKAKSTPPEQPLIRQCLLHLKLPMHFPWAPRSLSPTASNTCHSTRTNDWQGTLNAGMHWERK